MESINPQEIKRILIVKNDKIGDMVISTNLFRELKKSLPKSEITVIVSNVNKALVEKNKAVDKIIVADYPPKGLKGLADYSFLAKKLRKEKYDLGIDLRGSVFNIFFFLVLARTKNKIGFHNRYFSKFLLDYAYKKDRKNSHCTVQRLDLCNKAMGLNMKNSWPDIPASSKDVKEVNDFLKKNKIKKFISIVPDASLEKKQWSLERFDKTIKYIREKYPGYGVLLIGSNRKILDYLQDRNKFCVSLLNENLRKVYFLLKKSSLVISHDGGIMHLAWAARTNLIALFSKYLNVGYIGPLGKSSKVLISKDSAENKIPVEDVQREIDSFLKR